MRCAVRTLLLCLFAAACGIGGGGGGGEPVVHFVGLSRWTPEMVRDSMARVAPGVSLTDAACAVVLREDLGFAQAAVQRRVDRGVGGTRETVVISVVEPHDSARVQPVFASDTLPDRPAWADAIRLVNDREANAVHPLQFSGFFYDGEAPPIGDPTDGARRLRDEVARLAALPDALAHARDAVRHDANPNNRVVGALVLGHMRDEPSAWWALVHSLRRGSDRPGSISRMMLDVMSTRPPADLPWSPARRDLRALLSGTNLFAYLTVLEALTATRIDPGLGRTLIEPSYPYLRGNLEAPIADRRRIVRDFLRHVSGADAAGDDEAWIAWLDAFVRSRAERRARGQAIARRYAAALGDDVLTRGGACPFECCVYREWRAESDIPLRAGPDASAHVLEPMPAGTSFDADTGFVRITSPQIVLVTDTVPAYRRTPGDRYGGENAPLLPGDTVLVLDYAGEGHFALARGAERFQAEQFWAGADGWAPYDGIRGETLGEYASEWWVHARLPDGRQGWFRADADIRIGNADACG